MPDKPHPMLDLRAFRRREDRLLVIIIVAFLVLVGGVAIGLVYGWQTAAYGGACLLVGGGLFGLIWLILVLVERWSKGD